jgi:hypothetical protein
MAIHEDVPGIKAQIVDSRGHALEEYAGDSDGSDDSSHTYSDSNLSDAGSDSTDTEDDSTDAEYVPPHPVLINYVEARSGHGFAIKCNFHKKFATRYQVNCSASVDGEIVFDKLILLDDTKRRQEYIIRGVEDLEHDRREFSPFAFSELEISNYNPCSTSRAL